MPKIPPITKVAFQAARRPITSQVMPQNMAPTMRPTYRASVASLTSPLPA